LIAAPPSPRFQPSLLFFQPADDVLAAPARYAAAFADAAAPFRQRRFCQRHYSAATLPLAFARRFRLHYGFHCRYAIEDFTTYAALRFSPAEPVSAPLIHADTPPHIDCRIAAARLAIDAAASFLRRFRQPPPTIPLIRRRLA